MGGAGSTKSAHAIRSIWLGSGGHSFGQRSLLCLVLLLRSVSRYPPVLRIDAEVFCDCASNPFIFKSADDHGFRAGNPRTAQLRISKDKNGQRLIAFDQTFPPVPYRASDGGWIVQDVRQGSEQYPIVSFATIHVARFGDAKCVFHNEEDAAAGQSLTGRNSGRQVLETLAEKYG